MMEAYPALQYLPKGFSYEPTIEGHEVAVCKTCGVEVRNEEAHKQWHEAIETTFEYCMEVK